MLNIDEELKKIKKILQDTIVLDKIEIVPHYDWGNKVSVKCYQKIDDKIKQVEYSFYIEYYKDRDNYANALYLLHCDYDHGLGGHSYADKYESIEDFKNTNMYQKELLTEYGRDKKPVETKTQYEEMTLFDEITDDEDLIEDEEDIEEDDNTLFEEIEEEDPADDFTLNFFDNNETNEVDDLLSYGVDDYYQKEFKGKCVVLWKIEETLKKLPKYKEYYKKLKDYLFSILPVRKVKEVDFKEDKYVFENEDGTIIVKINNMQGPVYCYKMYENRL